MARMGKREEGEAATVSMEKEREEGVGGWFGKEIFKRRKS